MHKVSEKAESGGKLEVLEDFTKRVFLLRPQGIINPTLLEEDLSRAREFSRKVSGEWTYVTDTEGVRLVNPLNLLYLKEVKKLRKLKQIVIFAPGNVNRFLIRLSAFLIKPDRVIKDRNEFSEFLQNVH